MKPFHQVKFGFTLVQIGFTFCHRYRLVSPRRGTHTAFGYPGMPPKGERVLRTTHRPQSQNRIATRQMG